MCIFLFLFASLSQIKVRLQNAVAYHAGCITHDVKKRLDCFLLESYFETTRQFTYIYYYFFFVIYWDQLCPARKTFEFSVVSVLLLVEYSDI